MKYSIIISCLLAGTFFTATAQTTPNKDNGVFEPEPMVVTPGKASFVDAPSDALVLFGGKNLDNWVSGVDRSKPAKWNVHDGIVTVNKSVGDIQTKQSFSNYQLHIEWQIPANISGEGQERGNSGVFLASLGNGLGYELQVLDSYKNKTYIDGMAGSIYKQYVPQVNPARKPGEWESYDIVWIAPTFNEDGSLKSPAMATVFFNGVLVQYNVALQGSTWYEGHPKYSKHGPAPIGLQAHGDGSLPISYRNIWIRELK